MDMTSHNSARPMVVQRALIFLLLDNVAGTVGGIVYGPWDISIYY